MLAVSNILFTPVRSLRFLPDALPQDSVQGHSNVFSAGAVSPNMFFFDQTPAQPIGDWFSVFPPNGLFNVSQFRAMIRLRNSRPSGLCVTAPMFFRRLPFGTWIRSDTSEHLPFLPTNHDGRNQLFLALP